MNLPRKFGHLYSPRKDPDPEMIRKPEIIPKPTPKWSPFLFTSTPKWSPINFRNGMISKNYESIKMHNIRGPTQCACVTDCYDMIVYLMRWSNQACPSLGLYWKFFLIKFWIPAYFPSCGRWVILPVFKAGDIGDPNNYRGITVCSCLGKFSTLIINHRVTKYLDEHNITHKNQIGLRKGYRTSDHVFVLKSLVDL